MRRSTPWRWALPLLLAATLAPAEEAVVEILVVRNRPAADLVAALEPLVAPDGVVTASGDRLVVRASATALAQVRRVVRELDVAPRSLWITVAQGVDRASAARSADVSVQGGTRTRTVVTGAFARSGSQDSGSDVQRLRVLEGSRAFIRLGQAVPVPAVVVVPGPGGPVVAPATTYQEAERGFWVLPRVSGGQVTLEIETSADAPGARGGVDVQRVRTTVSGRLGEWLSVGAIARSSSAQSSGVLSSGERQETEDRSVRLMVEEAEGP